jgi:hypothetical protein
MFFQRIFLSLSLFLLISSVALADKKGETGRTATNLGCGSAQCHGTSSSQSTSVTFSSNSGSFTVAPGGKLVITVIVAHPTQAAAGFDAAIKTTANGSTNAGTLTTSSTDCKVANNEVTHTAPKAMSNGKAEFTFTWTAPATEGTYFLRAVGNAVNGDDRADADDLWNWATPVPIIVKQASGVENFDDNPIALTVFPNPTSDVVTMTYDIATFKGATLEITDLLGYSYLRQSVDNTSGTIALSTQSFPAGLYQVQLRVGSVQQLQRLVIIR